MIATLNKEQMTLLTLVLALMAGTTQHPPSGSVELLGRTFTQAELLALLGRLADALQAEAVARQRVHDLAADLVKIQAEVEPYVRAYVQAIRAMAGTSSLALGEYGLVPPKPRRPLTPEEKVAAAAKALATRKARGTMGPRERAKIHGDVSGVVVTPVTEGSAAPAAPDARTAPAAEPKAPATHGT